VHGEQFTYMGGSVALSMLAKKGAQQVRAHLLRESPAAQGGSPDNSASLASGPLVKTGALMEFTLTYRGALSASRSDVANKHHIRTAIHSQLTELWRQPRMQVFAPGYQGPYNAIREVGGIQFLALIVPTFYLVAELDILLLRAQPPGNLLTSGGDIDNRLKTLFDALSVPPHTNQIPADATPSSAPSPFYCLLMDDSLVTRVSVDTAELLDRSTSFDPSEVLALIRVKTRHTASVLQPL
jgi:hypothetical protein